MTRRIACLLVALLGLPILALGGEAKEPGKVEFPSMRLDLKSKTIEIDGSFCIGEYPLELLVCKDTLRDYEAMVTSHCKPSNLHTALLALGLKPRVRDQKDLSKIVREGDPIDIRIRFERDGKEVTVEPRELIRNVETKEHIGATPFVFYGSILFPDHQDENKMIYLADAEDWLLGLLGDAASVIDLAAGQTGKYGALEIDTKLAPPKGTKCTVIIRPAEAAKPVPNEQKPAPPKAD